MSNYFIMSDGKMFAMNADGSTTPIGAVDAQGNFSWPDGVRAVRPNSLNEEIMDEVRAELRELESRMEKLVGKYIEQAQSAVSYMTPVSNTENGHEWVDLGLPSRLKWSTCNVGATQPEKSGYFFAWGETKPKSEYITANYGLGQWKSDKGWSDFTSSKYIADVKTGDANRVDNKTVLDTVDDAAAVNWGGKWRTPTKDDFKELFVNCDWEYVSRDDVGGFLVKSNINSNSLFLPLCGCCDGSKSNCYGHYWSSSLRADHPVSAYSLYFFSGHTSIKSTYRYIGCPIRPVCP